MSGGVNVELIRGNKASHPVVGAVYLAELQAVGLVDGGNVVANVLDSDVSDVEHTGAAFRESRVAVADDVARGALNNDSLKAKLYAVHVLDVAIDLVQQ